MSDANTQIKVVGEKAKKLAQLGLKNLKEIDWKTKGAEAVSKVSVAKDKVVATWRSGRKGKVICMVGALMLAWIGSCMFGGGEVKAAKGRFVIKGKDLQSEAQTDKLFYVKGKDDGFTKVWPNLKRIPKWVHSGPLAHCLNPHLDADLRNRSKAYLNDPDYTFGSWCIVEHVDDDHVIVRPNDPSWSGEFYGYVQTDDDYVEGANLKKGFYAFTGQRKVPLTNGSSVSMYSFVAIDAEVNQAVLCALEHNLKAEEAAKYENSMREIAKREHEKKVRDVAVYKALEKEASTFKIPDIHDQIHLYREMQTMIDSFYLQGDRIFSVGSRWTTEVAIKQLISEKKWKDMEMWAFHVGEGTPEAQAKNIMDCYRISERRVRMRDLKVDQFRLSVQFVAVNPLEEGNACELKKVDFDNNGPYLSIRLCEQIYIFPNTDEDLKCLTDDKRAFVAAFEKKYGK